MMRFVQLSLLVSLCLGSATSANEQPSAIVEPLYSVTIPVPKEYTGDIDGLNIIVTTNEEGAILKEEFDFNQKELIANAPWQFNDGKTTCRYIPKVKCVACCSSNGCYWTRGCGGGGGPILEADITEFIIEPKPNDQGGIDFELRIERLRREVEPSLTFKGLSPELLKETEALE